jgi:hypothetical protein
VTRFLKPSIICCWSVRSPTKFGMRSLPGSGSQLGHPTMSRC